LRKEKQKKKNLQKVNFFIAWSYEDFAVTLRLCVFAWAFAFLVPACPG